MTSPIDRVSLESLSISDLQKQKLKELFPEVFTEGNKVDFDRLKRTLGDMVDAGKERFGMNWAGKADCFKTIQQPSIATLVPARDESVDFDTTENLFIEGDNLEVLKLLQKSYLGKVKMIYIDPPYNTGNDFIYPDNYSENLDTYLEYTGQIDGEGRKFSTNVDTDGRFHSKWMNMMYPRLFLAKNLLREDGVIFVSINDKEIHNLRFIMNELFGDENFLVNLIWDKNHSAQAGIFKVYHEYVLVYAKNIENIGTPTSSNNDLFEAGAMKKESPRHPMQEFTFPSGVRFDAPEGTELIGSWGGAEKVELVTGHFVCENGKTKYPVTIRAAFTQKNQMQQFFYGDKESLIDSRGQKVVEFYFNSSGKIKIVKERGVFTPASTLAEYGTQSSASTDLAELFEMAEAPLETPKPPRLMSDFASWFCDEQDIVMDFFAGSASTAQSVFELNSKTNKKLNFILVQLPEICDLGSAAYKAGYQTIAEISKERIRRAAAKIKTEQTEAQAKADLFDDGTANTVLDLGFRVFKLQKSNFKVWDANTPKDAEAIQQALELHVDHIDPQAEQEAILFELLLKSGFELTTPIQKFTLADKQVYSIAHDILLICLDKALTLDVIKAMAELNPSRVICLDEGFQDNDQLKTNAVLIMKSKGVNDFRTV